MLYELGDFHAHAEGDGEDGFAGVAAGGGVAFDGGFGAERVEINADDAADGVDGADSLAAGGEGGAGGIFDVGDVGGHFGPDGDFGG